MEDLYKKTVFFVHRDFEKLAGRSLFDLYINLCQETKYFILHITKSYLEDEDCQLQIELLLSFIKENKVSGHRILIIHGDKCELPEKLILASTDLNMQDWIQIKNDNEKTENIIGWLEKMKKQQVTLLQSWHLTGDVCAMIL